MKYLICLYQWFKHCQNMLVVTVRSKGVVFMMFFSFLRQVRFLVCGSIIFLILCENKLKRCPYYSPYKLRLISLVNSLPGMTRKKTMYQ